MIEDDSSQKETFVDSWKRFLWKKHLFSPQNGELVPHQWSLFFRQKRGWSGDCEGMHQTPSQTANWVHRILGVVSRTKSFSSYLEHTNYITYTIYNSSHSTVNCFPLLFWEWLIFTLQKISVIEIHVLCLFYILVLFAIKIKIWSCNIFVRIVFSSFCVKCLLMHYGNIINLCMSLLEHINLYVIFVIGFIYNTLYILYINS